MARQSKKELIEQITLASRAQHNEVDVFDDAACERLGINRTDLRCMDILGQRGPLTAGELAEAAKLTTGAVTAVVDRLERIGYVRRLSDPADRRCVVVEATGRAFRRSGSIWGPLGADFTSLLGTYTTEELGLILDFLRRGSEMQREHLTRVKGGGGGRRDGRHARPARGRGGRRAGGSSRTRRGGRGGRRGSGAEGPR
jgi:DNA-binding MarR family transcriptional regulator